jgi:hypothetical protein
MSKLRNAGQSLPDSFLEQIAQTHFASIKRDWKGESKPEPDFPMECHGIDSERSRRILKALLDSNDKSMEVLSSVIAITTFSARVSPVVQPYLHPHLVAFAHLLA